MSGYPLHSVKSLSFTWMVWFFYGPESKVHIRCFQGNYPDVNFRAKIVKEVVEDLIHPAYLAKKYTIPVVEIRTWVAQAGQRLPNNFKTPLDIWATDSTKQTVGKSTADVPAKSTQSSRVQKSFSLCIRKSWTSLWLYVPQASPSVRLGLMYEFHTMNV